MVSDHVSLAHLLSASASWWAIRGVIPIHSTGVPNARMTLPPLAVTAYRSSPSSSGVRAPWMNLPVSPSGVPWARVSAFIAWIVSAIFACCIASLNHRSPLVFIPLHHGLHLERPSHRGSPPVVVTVSSLARTFCFLGRRPTLCGFPTEGSPAGVYM